MAKDWDKESTTYLKRYAITKNLVDIAERYETDEDDVEQRLVELKLTTRDGRGYQAPFVDPTISHFEKGLEAFHAKNWAAARKSFAAVLEECEQLELSARARLFLKACDEQEEGEGTGIDDAFLAAVVAKNNGDFDTALEITKSGGRAGKDERFAYLLASLTALGGEPEEALEQLEKAIAMNPENRIHAFHDSDFEALHELEEFQALYESESEVEAVAE